MGRYQKNVTRSRGVFKTGNFFVTSLFRGTFQVKKKHRAMEEELSFIVDTKASDDSELLKTFNSPFPLFGGSKFSLGVESNDDKSDDEVSASHDEDEYFGKLRLNNINNELLLIFLMFYPHRPSTSINQNTRRARTMSNQSRIFQKRRKSQKQHRKENRR